MSTVTILRPLETPHFFLREMQLEDAGDLGSFMTQPRYQKYISHRLRDENEVNAFVRRHTLVQADMRRRVYHLVAEEKHASEAVGDGFLIDHGNKDLEIGWGLHPAMWRLGFGTEIGRGLLAFAFEQLNADLVWCKVMRPNVASRKLAERIGLHLWKSVPDMEVVHGQHEDVDFYTLSVTRYFELPY